MRMVSGIEWSEAASVSREQGKAANVVGEMLYEAQDAAAFVGGLPQNATPGKYYNYSTGNYQLVQYNLRQDYCSRSWLLLHLRGAVHSNCSCDDELALSGIGPWAVLPCNRSHLGNVMEQ